jgi:hypothetical protein
MPFTRPNLTRPFPRPAARRPRRAVRIAGGVNPLAGVTFGTWDFAVRVWIAFDAPTVAAPNWIEITNFVEHNIPINIVHGRADGLGDVNATTCTLTVDNSDGRFCAANPNGVWFGQIHKGSWLRVEVVTPWLTVSSRLVGFITALPTGWSGLYATSQISAADRYEKLGNAPALVSSIQSEVLTDPNLTGNVKGYWNLHEPTGSTTFGDTSGQGAQHLTLVGVGTSPGVGFGASNVAAPGFDGLRCPTFAPISTSQGSYLTTTIAMPPGVWAAANNYTGLLGTVEFWVQATTVGVVQTLAAFVDPVGQVSWNVIMDANGYISFQLNGASASNSTGVDLYDFARSGNYSINDGKWHRILFGIAGTSSFSGAVVYVATVDDFYVGIVGGASVITCMGAFAGFTQLVIGAGYRSGALNLGAANFSDVAFLWANYQVVGSADLRPPNLPDHFAAGASGFLGESTDYRVARIARYAGVPIPLTISGFIGTTGKAQIYNPTKGPWTNLSPGAHSCGTQSVSGRKALDAMREAARTEGMPLFVDRSGYLALQNSTIRQNTTPAWTVDAHDLEAATGLADDFAYTVNQMTVTPNSQAAQTVIGTVGTASQAKYGIYDKSQATASLTPVEARSLGSAYIQLGADPAPRLAPVVVEAATLAGVPGYGNAWYDAVLATEISTPFRVTNVPDAAGGGSMDAFVEGWTETIVAGTHTFSFSTSPVQGPTYQLDDVVLGRADTDGSTLTAGITSVATTLSLTTTGTATGSAPWTMNPADFPLDVGIAGEQVTLTGFNPPTLGTADPSFESGVSGWSVSGTVTVAQSSADHYVGSFSGLVNGGASGAGFLFPTTANSVTANAKYWAAVSFKLLSGSANVHFYVQWLGTPTGTYDFTTVAATSSWVTVAGPATAIPSATTAYPAIQLSGSANFQLYVDFFVFQSYTTTQPFTVTRSVNGVINAPAAGTPVSLWSPTTLAY